MPIIEFSRRKFHYFKWYFSLSSLNDEVAYLPWLLPYPNNKTVDRDTVLRSIAATQLCLLCQCLNFEYLFSTGLDGSLSAPQEFVIDGKKLLLAENAIGIGSVGKLQNRAEYCSFCGLVWQALGRQQNRFFKFDAAELKDVWVYLSTKAIDYNGLVSDDLEGDDEEESSPPPLPPPRRNMLEVVVDVQKGADEAFGIVYHDITQGADVYIALDDPKLGSARSLTETVDTEFLRQWLDSCNGMRCKCDGSCGGRSKSAHIDTRFIDVKKNQIVSGSTGSTRYAALSYMWGNSSCVTLESSNISILTREGGLETFMDKMPRTIIDAMRLCRGLDIDYLWVDGLCIQQDTGDKIKQIQGMHAIYTGSFVTIVAAGGFNADYGLPGVTKREVPQYSAVVKGMHLTTLPPGQVKIIESAGWSTRAWTYQERLLSDRMLVFTDEQVIFKCRHSTGQESSRMDIHNVSHQVNCSTRSFEGYNIKTSEMIDFEVYANVVHEYTSRKLTAQDDIIYALQGLLNVLAPSFVEPDFVQGLPVHLLDVALLWRPAQPLTRRKGWPSWSWTGWMGQVTYPGLIHLAERTKSLIEPAEFEGGGQARGEKDFQSAVWTRQYSMEDGIYYTSSQESSDRWHCRPTENHRFEHMIQYEGTVLSIRAFVAEMMIAGADDDDPFRRNLGDLALWKGDDGTINAVPMIVVDENNARAGVIIVDINVAYRIKPGKYRLVCLSQTTVLFDDIDPAWDEDTNSYAGKPGKPAINPQEDSPSEMRKFKEDRGNDTLFNAWFDSKTFEYNICWPLYNVMMIDDQNERLGLGLVHIHPFDRVKQSLKIDLR